MFALAQRRNGQACAIFSGASRVLHRFGAGPKGRFSYVVAHKARARSSSAKGA